MKATFVKDVSNARLARNMIDRCEGKKYEYIVERTIYMSKREFIFFREHLLEEETNIVKCKDNMFVDENGVWHVLMFCCMCSDIMILVNSKKSKYAKYVSIICNGGEKVEKRFSTNDRYKKD